MTKLNLCLVNVLVLLFVTVGASSDYPITNPADSIHPGQESLVLTTLLQREASGETRLGVEDSTAVDPRQWLLLKTPDGELQETHCIKSVSEQEVKLSEKLRRTFLGGAQLVQGSIARERGIVARLTEDAGGGASTLTLDSSHEIDALEQIVLQSVDGRIREAHCVKSVVGRRLELYEDLRNDYAANSAVIQGRLLDGQPENEDNPCCCPGKRAGRGSLS